MWNAHEVHEYVATTGSEPNATTASRLRSAGKIYGVKVGAAYQFPVFQFDAKTGQPLPEMAELLKLLPKDSDGWKTAFWLAQPNYRLATERALVDLDSDDALEQLDAPMPARTPAEVFAENPARVVAFARQEFHGA
jgi:hypothetical protein